MTSLYCRCRRERALRLGSNKKDRLEKRNVKLGAYDEEQDTWEITEGLKETDYIVWPDGECKEGAADSEERKCTGRRHGRGE